MDENGIVFELWLQMGGTLFSTHYPFVPSLLWIACSYFCSFLFLNLVLSFFLWYIRMLLRFCLLCMLQIFFSVGTCFLIWLMLFCNVEILKFFCRLIFCRPSVFCRLACEVSQAQTLGQALIFQGLPRHCWK